jgi:hypothetical protein
VTVTTRPTARADWSETAGEILKFSDSSIVDHLNAITLDFVLPVWATSCK